MSDNFFLDNPDLQFRLDQIDLREVLEFREHGYADAAQYPDTFTMNVYEVYVHGTCQCSPHSTATKTESNSADVSLAT